MLKGLLQPAIEVSFNAVTVDSDTSTSDTCLVFATQKAGIEPIVSPTTRGPPPSARRWPMCCGFSPSTSVRDGEGATKMVTVTVEGAESDRSAFRIAQSIANARWSRPPSPGRTPTGAAL